MLNSNQHYECIKNNFGVFSRRYLYVRTDQRAQNHIDGVRNIFIKKSRIFLDKISNSCTFHIPLYCFQLTIIITSEISSARANLYWSSNESHKFYIGWHKRNVCLKVLGRCRCPCHYILQSNFDGKYTMEIHWCSKFLFDKSSKETGEIYGRQKF